MNRFPLKLTILLITVFSLPCVGFSQIPNLPSSNSPCSIIPADVISKVQSAPFVDGTPSLHDDGYFKISTCYYKLRPESRSVSLEVIRPSKSGAGSPSRLWKDKFQRVKRDDADAEKASEDDRDNGPEHISNVGDDAFWVSTGRDGALYVLEGDWIFRLSLGGGTPRQEKKTRAIAIIQSMLRTEAECCP
jgi:hypothetical protein